MHSLTRSCLVIASLLTPIVTATSQEPAHLRQPDAVPYELAAALISAGGLPSDPQIMIGGMPEWISNRLVLPANARILGSAYIGTTAVSIISLPPGADSALVDLKRNLAQKGWKNPPP